MIFRLSRLRFIVVRSCLISLIIIVCLRFVAYFTDDDRQHSSNKLLTSGEIFWEKIAREDRRLSNEERIERLRFKDDQGQLNWTEIFLDSYEKKLAIFNERDSKTTDKYYFEEKQPIPSQDIFEIYEETLVFQQPKFCSSKRIFHPQCPYSNCRWSCKQPLANARNLRRASVFHHVDIKPDEMRDKLARRSSNDIWILWIDEANRDIEDLNKYQFNWTLSFRQDSEVSIGSYGILIQRNRQLQSSTDHPDLQRLLIDANIPIPNLAIEYRIFLNFRYRHKHALWFVSNCQPQRRLNYYNELKSHYPIEAFGVCVEKKCDKNNHCESDQSRLALFYLAFESQTCTDYITEKFWRALYYGMIPIVLGPSKQSYFDLGVPSSAFIHVDDFASAADLGKYLHRISNDYFLYRNFFQWLNAYEIFYDIRELEPIRMCELCMRLNKQQTHDHSFYRNLHHWHRIGC